MDICIYDFDFDIEPPSLSENSSCQNDQLKHLTKNPPPLPCDYTESVRPTTKNLPDPPHRKCFRLEDLFSSASPAEPFMVAAASSSSNLIQGRDFDNPNVYTTAPDCAYRANRYVISPQSLTRKQRRKDKSPQKNQFESCESLVSSPAQDRIIARLQPPYSLDCNPVEAEFQDLSAHDQEGPKRNRKYIKKATEYWENKKTGQAQPGKKVTIVSASKANNQEGPKWSTKYIKKATEFWENKKNRKSVVEDEQTIYGSRYKEKAVVDLNEITDLSVSISNRPRTNISPQVSPSPEEEEQFKEDRFNVDPDSWQLRKWPGIHNWEWNLPDQKYVSQIPEPLQFYIEGTRHVPRDGHCGFHTIAFYLGLSSVDGFQEVRRYMFCEVVNNKAFYEDLLGGKPGYTEALNRLKFEEGKVKSDSKWFDMPWDGFIAAQTFRSVVIWISGRGCATFFPFRHGPTKGIEHRVIVMAFVDGNHFVPMKLKSNAPIPQTWSVWKMKASGDARNWPNHYKTRMETFCNIMNIRSDN